MQLIMRACIENIRDAAVCLFVHQHNPCCCSNAHLVVANQTFGTFSIITPCMQNNANKANQKMYMYTVRSMCAHTHRLPQWRHVPHCSPIALCSVLQRLFYLGKCRQQWLHSCRREHQQLTIKQGRCSKRAWGKAILGCCASLRTSRGGEPKINRCIQTLVSR